MKEIRAAYCNRATLLVVSGLLLAACSSEPSEPLQPGQAQYLKYCSACHGKSGEGRSLSFPPLKGSDWLSPGPEAVALIVLGGLRGEIEVSGKIYRGYMPPMRQISNEDIAALLGYIDRRWAQWTNTPDAGRIGQLREQIKSAGPIQGREELDRLLEKETP